MAYGNLYKDFPSDINSLYSAYSQMNTVADDISGRYGQYAYQTLTPFGGTELGFLVGRNNGELDKNYWFSQQLAKGIRANMLHNNGVYGGNTYSMTFGNKDNGLEFGTTRGDDGTSYFASGQYTKGPTSIGTEYQKDALGNNAFSVSFKRNFGKDGKLSFKANKKKVYGKYERKL